MKNITMGNQQATQIELGWLAGIIDGEGYLGLSVSKKITKLKNYQCITPMMHICNTDEAIVLRAKSILEKIGITTYVRTTAYKSLKDNYKNCYRVQVKRYNNMIKLLEKICIYLTGNKKKRGELVLKYCKLRNASWIPGKRHPYSEKELEIVEKCLPLQRRGASETIRKIQLEKSKIYEMQKKRERAESMNHKILVYCDNCRKEYNVSPSYLEGHEHHFCSIICRVAFQGKYGKLYQHPKEQVVKI